MGESDILTPRWPGPGTPLRAEEAEILAVGPARRPASGGAEEIGPIAEPRAGLQQVDLGPVAAALKELTPLRAADVSAGIEGERAGVAPERAAEKVGILLINLGTPDAAEPKAVRAYLREFLNDPRVIEQDGLLWRMVLNGIILPLRPRVKAKAYRKIWNAERNESPLKTITRAQSEKLAAALGTSSPGVVVGWAMRYGNPSIPSRLAALAAAGCDRILLMPLYPQYSAASTATACDAAFMALMRMRRQPAVRVLPPYYADPIYIEALASSVRRQLAAQDAEPEVILASYHGMPLAYVEKGDPYAEQCIATTRLLRERLSMSEDKLIMTFQSRFGRGQWLEPATDKTVKALARKGVRRLAVVTPGFAADCLETLEEIAVENAHIFKKNGGERFMALQCLNDSDEGMRVLTEAASRELAGWR